jgi:glycosyltransferase involved in cell wall biosynthesis
MKDDPATAEISVIIPVGARHADITALYADYKAGLERLGRKYEIIFVLDGARSKVASALRALLAAGERLVVIGLTRPFGEATALMAGFQRATGRIIMTLPAYYQVEPGEIGKLVQALDSADLVVARRWPRAGSRLEAIRRSVFHKMIAGVTSQRFRDLGCSARAMHRKVLEEIALYGDQHRFLPVLAGRQGFRVCEVDVAQSALDRFDGSYRAREYAHRALDILTVLFLVRFTKKPLRFFGMMGVITFGIGALLITWMVIERAFLGESLASRPALLLSSLLVVLGMQLFALGLLGELIIFTHARELKDYQVAEVIRSTDILEPSPQRDASGSQSNQTAAGAMGRVRPPSTGPATATGEYSRAPTSGRVPS